MSLVYLLCNSFQALVHCQLLHCEARTVNTTIACGCRRSIEKRPVADGVDAMQTVAIVMQTYHLLLTVTGNGQRIVTRRLKFLLSELRFTGFHTRR